VRLGLRIGVHQRAPLQHILNNQPDAPANAGIRSKIPAV
jgi:hypothetical protein